MDFNSIVHKCLFLGIRKTVFELPPCQDISEAEEAEGGEAVSGFARLKADGEAATPAVVVGRGHEVIVISFGADHRVIV